MSDKPKEKPESNPDGYETQPVTKSESNGVEKK